MSKPTLTGRGFARWETVETSYGAEVRIYESSSAEGSFLWLAVTQPPPEVEGQLPASETHAHLSLEQAEAVRDTLGAAIDYRRHRARAVAFLGLAPEHRRQIIDNLASVFFGGPNTDPEKQRKTIERATLSELLDEEVGLY